MTDFAASQPLSPETLSALRQEIAASLHCALPGIIISFDADAQTATVRPALRMETQEGAILSAPLLRDVPVLLPRTEEEIHFLVTPGDFCLLIFADVCVDGWFTTGGDPLPPSPRRHDLADAFALVGLKAGAAP